MRFTQTTAGWSTGDEAESLSMLVDAFAKEMKAKLRKTHRKGWDDPDELPGGRLLELLKQQVGRADMDPIDVANFAAFVWNRRGESIKQEDK